MQNRPLVRSRSSFIRFFAPALAAAVALSMSSAPAFAIDGVIEINGVSALNGGITPGDTPGFPISITESGSYVLTGNIAPSSGSTIIDVTADDVTLDLNGFKISAGFVCTGSGAALSCPVTAPPAIRNLGHDRMTVRNGTIVGVGFGVIAQNQSRIENITIRHASFDAIQAKEDVIVSGCNISTVGGEGIDATDRAMIRDNTIFNVKSAAIKTANYGTIRENTTQTTGGGIDVGFGFVINGNSIVTTHSSKPGITVAGTSTLSGNAVSDTGGNGIEAGDGSLVERNNVAGYPATATGITAGSYSNVQRNNILGLGVGLSLGSETAYRENNISSVQAATVTGTGTDMFNNSCNGATTCP